jgi:hypothetical protein
MANNGDARPTLEWWAESYFAATVDDGARQAVDTVARRLVKTMRKGDPNARRVLHLLTPRDAVVNPEAVLRDADLPATQVEESRRHWHALRRFISASLVRDNGTVIDVIEMFYGESIELVEPERTRLPTRQLDVLFAMVSEYYQQWTKEILPAPPERGPGVAFPLLSAPPTIRWLGGGSPLPSISANFTLYIPRFTIIDPLAAIAAAWTTSTWHERDHRDALHRNVGREKISEFVSECLELLRDIAPLVRKNEVALLPTSQLVRFGEHRIARMQSLLDDGLVLPAGTDPSHLQALLVWDDVASYLDLRTIAADRASYDILASAFQTALHSRDGSFEARRTAVLQRAALPQLQTGRLRDLVALRDAVDPLVELRGVLAPALSELECRGSQGLTDEDVFALMNEQIAPAAHRLDREIRRSSALESIAAGGLVLVGGAYEFVATGQLNALATAVGATAGLAPWLAWRARRRFSPDEQHRTVLRDVLIGLTGGR